MSQAKVERLLNLMATLLDAPRPVTADEIRRRVPGYPETLASFRRAFERDKDELRAMGVPLRLEPVPATDPPAEGYRIRKDEYYLRDPGLESDERAALQFAAATVRLEGLAGTGALWKLGGREPDAAEEQTLADLPGDPNLATVFSGVIEQRRVGFSYHDTARLVDPWQLNFRRGRWYLTGYDHTRGAERVFRLDRVEGEVVAEGRRSAFTRPAGAKRRLQLEAWQIGEGEPVTARVRIDGDTAASIVHENRPGAGPLTIVEQHDDGSVEVELEVTALDGFRSFLLPFLEHAEVLAPSSLRADVVAWLEAIESSAVSETRR